MNNFLQKISVRQVFTLVSRPFSISYMHKAPAAMVHGQQPDIGDVTINVPRDPNTLSNYNNFRTKHTAVDFKIDFTKKLLHGQVSLTFDSLTNAETNKIVLDSSFLDIHEVKVAGKSVKWNIGDRFEPYGSPLNIELEKGVDKDDQVQVDISVSTTDKCTALQWLTPAQTSNHKHPYMFSQCQAIHARSLFPCQDTPDVKSTFDFKLQSPLQVLASGLTKGTEDVPNSDEKIYKYRQEVPIPSYLFAVASGDIVGAPIGPRSTVWTGPEELEACKWEFEQDTEPYIKAAEKLIYDYAWGTYNVLVLPPSFPYGGMENPVYTFATPTVISGDRENVDLVAHELAHSWSGNLVSNASWEHFWLNEGWTVYTERRLAAAIHGEPQRDFSAIIGWKALEDSVENFGADHEFTKMIVDLKGKDPDDAFSSIPYEKGYTFLTFLEKVVGTEKWDKFIPHYFNTYKFKSVDSYEFKDTLLKFFESDSEASSKLESEVDWDKWFYTAGLPPKPKFDTSMADVCYDLVKKWISLLDSTTSAKFEPNSSDIKDLTSSQLVVFLEALQKHTTPAITPSLIQRMESTYHLASSNNVELSSRFLVLGLKAKDTECCKPAVELLGKVGRMKFVRPLFRNLKIVDEALAKKTYEENKNFYHPICAGMVEKDLAK